MIATSHVCVRLQLMPENPGGGGVDRRGVLLGGMCLPTVCGAVGSGVAATDRTMELQAKIDAAARVGGTVSLPPGVFRLASPLNLRSGVSLQGSGRHYEFKSDGNHFTGTWLRYEGPAGESALRLRSVQNCGVRAIGIDCREVAGTTAIEIGSDNNPATKALVFEEMSIFGAGLGVRWGLENRLAALEQCDDISFRDIVFHSCVDGFRIDAMNAADYSRVERVTFSQLRGTAFDLRNPGFMAIADCAAGALSKACIMFRVSGQSPDPLRISGCQMEPTGRFLVATGPNDQGQIVLEANVINNPIDVEGVLRIDSRANYINDQVRLTGFVRWRSREDIWDGISNRPKHERQVVRGPSAQFVGSSMLNADHHFGSHLPLGFRLERDDPAILGEVVVREGILCPVFTPGKFAIDHYVRPRQDNGRAYRVVHPGVAPIEPDRWGERARAGSVEFEAVGPAALTRHYGPLASDG